MKLFPGHRRNCTGYVRAVKKVIQVLVQECEYIEVLEQEYLYKNVRHKQQYIVNRCVLWGNCLIVWNLVTGKTVPTMLGLFQSTGLFIKECE